jgi:formylaminopyrimidine deformylase / aminopyrimidine aminohydrolase
MISQAGSVTTHLLSIPTQPTYLSATKTHPFLASAADGTLPNDRLAFWLYQDHIYAACAYPRFIGSLISHIPFDQPHLCADHPQAILRILVGALENIMLEVEFFKNTAKKWGLDLNVWKERKETRDYTAEMARVAANGTIQEGLLFLWAMEKVSSILVIFTSLQWETWIRPISMHGLTSWPRGRRDLNNQVNLRCCPSLPIGAL